MALPKRINKTSRPSVREQMPSPTWDDTDTIDGNDESYEPSYVYIEKPEEEEFEEYIARRGQPEVLSEEDVEDLHSERSISGISSSVGTIGKLTARDLMTHSWKEWAHLDEKVLKLTLLMQKLLSDNDLSEEIRDARLEGGDEYVKMVLTIEAMILREMSKGTVGRENPYHVDSADKPVFIARVINEILGLGPLEPLYADESVTEIMANGPFDIQVEIKGTLHKVPGARFRDDEHLFDICSNMLTSVNKRIDIKEPMADGRLPDKSRINVTHSSIGGGRTNLTIRRHPKISWSLRALVESGAMSEEIAAQIGFLIYNGCSTVIIGGTGSGKTSMLNALSGAFPRTTRTITVEDNLELKLNPDRTVLPLEARAASTSGEGAITIRMLVRNTLRMRPDRIVVGEVRDATTYDMLQAMNTGHEGSMTTIHANDALSGIDRLANLATESGNIDHKGVNSLIAGSVDLIVVVRRFHEDNSRRLAGIYEVPNRPQYEEETGISSVVPRPLWEWIHTHTNDDGSIEGEYRKINDISDGLRKKKRLDTAKPMSIEEIYELSDHSPLIEEEQDDS